MDDFKNILGADILNRLEKRGITKFPNESLADREKRMQQADLDATMKYYQHDRMAMFNSSLIGQKEALKHTFDDFNITSQDQARELSEVQSIAERIANGEHHHYTFTGTPGSGKSMLAIALLNQLKGSHTCFFVDFAMLISLTRQFKDDRAMVDVNRVMRAIKLADIVVIDDLGSESSMQRNIKESSNFTQSKLFEIAQYRDLKTAIITTNHTSRELKQIYDDKLVSRLIMTNGSKNVVRFNSEDYRRYTN